MANVTITNPGLRGLYQNMALSQIFPSGWEVNNLRLDEVENSVEEALLPIKISEMIGFTPTLTLGQIKRRPLKYY